MVDPPGSLSAAADALLRAPLFQTRYLRGYGTLYGAVYQPQSGGVELLWRDRRWLTSLQSLQDGLREVVYTADESDAER